MACAAAAAAKSLQSCPTLCDPIDGSPPGSPVPGILQARTVEWIAISFSNAWKWKVKVKSLSRVRLLATPWTAAYQAPPSMGFSRQEYWSGVPLPSPPWHVGSSQIRDWTCGLLHWKADSLPLSHQGRSWLPLLTRTPVRLDQSPLALFYLNSLCKGPVSKHDHILSPGGQSFQHMTLGNPVQHFQVGKASRWPSGITTQVRSDTSCLQRLQ